MKLRATSEYAFTTQSQLSHKSWLIVGNTRCEEPLTKTYHAPYNAADRPRT